MLPIAPWLSAMRIEPKRPQAAKSPHLAAGVAGLRRSIGRVLIALGHWMAGAEAAQQVSVGR